MKPKLKTGDVVVIEWKDVYPHILNMKKYDGCIGIIEQKAIESYWVQITEHCYLIWHPTSLTKIGEL